MKMWSPRGVGMDRALLVGTRAVTTVPGGSSAGTLHLRGPLPTRMSRTPGWG